MDTTLHKIETFLQKHHTIALATSDGDALNSCTLFYAYIASKQLFIFASDRKTQHIKNILHNPKVAGSVALETKKIGKIQGLQFRGVCKLLEQRELRKYYYKAFPYAIAMNPTLWSIDIEYFKYTDNTLGFAKKLVWEKSTQ